MDRKGRREKGEILREIVKERGREDGMWIGKGGSKGWERREKGEAGFEKLNLVFRNGEGEGGLHKTPKFLTIFILRTRPLYKGTLNNKARLYLG